MINLVSTNTSSAAACPGGESLEFTFSPNGHWTLALSSSRIYVIDTLSPNVSVQRELKVQRRPLSTSILDDGSLLAVLSSDHRVNIYNLANRQLIHCRALSMDNPPNSIALSPKGEVLAAAYNGGIEVHSLATSAMSTGRRAVKCDSVDSLAFSHDGTLLLGTTQNSKSPNTVVMSAPYYSEPDQETPSADILSHMWTGQILFPNNTRDCSHAALLSHHAEGDSSWTYTYDRVFESFRAVRTDDLRNGTTFFTGPKTSGKTRPSNARRKLVPCTLPATSDRGELVAAGFFGKELWIYGVPESLDSTAQVDELGSRNESIRRSSIGSSNERRTRSPARSLTSGETAELKSLPRWQMLVDRSRNIFAEGRRLTDIPGIAAVHWVRGKIQSPNSYSLAQRLLIVAPGGLSHRPDTPDELAIVDGGRLVILDFDRRKDDGTYQEFTIEVGNVPPETLEEEHVDMDTEIALVRQRTVRQRRDATIGTSVAQVLAPAPDLPLQVPPVPPVPPLPPLASSAVNGANVNSGESSSVLPAAHDDSVAEGLSLEEASAVFDGPYSHTHPRSRSSLYRSATAVAANRQRNPPRILLSDHAVIRRADGRGELPHECDADNWVPPPPPYTPDPDRPLPEHLRIALLPRHTEPLHHVTEEVEILRQANTIAARQSRPFTSRRMTTLPERPRAPFRPALSNTWSTRPPLSRPLSTTSFSPRAAPRDISPCSTHTSPATPISRPQSASAGGQSGSSHNSLRGRLMALGSQVPEPLTNGRLNHAKSASVPSSRNTAHPRLPSLTLSGANLQRRLEYPLPLAPHSDAIETLPPPSPIARSRPLNIPDPVIAPITLGMPSPQQLANLDNRYQSPSSGEANGPLRSELSVRIRRGLAAPPRAALGAALGAVDTLSSPVAERRRFALAQRNSLAASSPSLLRPKPHRLETIDSIASTISRSGTRPPSRDIHVGGTLRRGRSRSLGPVTRVARGEAKKGWFRRRRAKTSGPTRTSMEGIDQRTNDDWVDSCGDGDEGFSKCKVM